MAGVPPISGSLYNNTVQASFQQSVSQTDPRILAARMITLRQPMYRTFTAYYNGQHRLAFASEKFRNAFGRLFFQFADNLCPTVVNAVSDRLKIIDWAVENGPQNMGKEAWKLWQDQRMDRKAGEIHQEAIRAGDGFVLIWPDPDTGQPTFYPQMSEQVTVFYDDEVPGKMLWAAKGWVNPDNFIRLNMYYPDRIEKWITVKKMAAMPTNIKFWTKFQAPGETWPLVNQWGRVPVFHFINDAPPGRFGRSDLKDALPIQDALNKSVIDMLVAMEYISLPQRWATGMELEVDENTGLPVLPFQPAVDRVWTVADDKVQFGQFPAADLNQLLAVQNDLRLEMARVTGTPLHYMMMVEQPPSGEALKTLEDRLTKKVLDRQETFGSSWEDAMAFALKMANTYEGDDLRLSAKWNNPAPKSELEEAQTQQIKSVIGVSRRQLLYEMGYTETEIDQMEKDNAADDQQDLDQQVQKAQALAIAVPPTPGAQIQPPGKTSPAVQPAPDGQKLDSKGKPTTAKPVKNQG